MLFCLSVPPNADLLSIQLPSASASAARCQLRIDSAARQGNFFVYSSDDGIYCVGQFQILTKRRPLARDLYCTSSTFILLKRSIHSLWRNSNSNYCRLARMRTAAEVILSPPSDELVDGSLSFCITFTLQLESNVRLEARIILYIRNGTKNNYSNKVVVCCALSTMLDTKLVYMTWQ